MRAPRRPLYDAIRLDVVTAVGFGLQYGAERQIVSLKALASVTVLLVAVCGPAAAQAEWRVVDTFRVGGPGGWDYVTVDPQSHRLYVPRTSHTLVIDGESGKTLA